MKLPSVCWLVSGLALAFLPGCQSGSTEAATDDSRVTVSYENSENFTDFKDGLQGTDRGRENLEYQMRRAVVEEASHVLQPGQRLAITFTDIDLAGDYLPSAPTTHDFRVIRAVYPPRMNFRWVLTDGSGATINQGEEKLTDLAFQNNVNPIGRNEELFYDRSLFRDWVRRALRK